MDLTPSDVAELVTELLPRRITDLTVARLSSDHVPEHPVVLVLDEDVWRYDIDLGRSLHSMTLEQARQLYNQLGQVIDLIDGDLPA